MVYSNRGDSVLSKKVFKSELTNQKPTLLLSEGTKLGKSPRTMAPQFKKKI